MRWAEDEAFWLWHTVNAYASPGRPGEADGPDPTVRLDYIQWPRLALRDSRRRARDVRPTGRTAAVWP